MSEKRRVDIVKFDERTLWKLHEKLKKMQAKEKDAPDDSVTISKRRERKPPKFQVYQPGVTRLSSRKLAANFDKTTLGNDVGKSSGDRKTESKGNSQPEPKTSRDTNQTRSAGSRGTSTANARAHRPSQRNKHGDDPARSERPLEEEDEGEGFLARHRRRKKQGAVAEDFSEDEADDDELAWDGYGGSGLVQEGWSPQVTTTETSSQEGGELSDHEVCEELSFDEEKGEKKSVQLEQIQKDTEDDLPAPDDEPVATPSEPNKEYYKVAHSISSESEEDFGDEEYQHEEEEEDEYIDSKPRRPQLFDPNNPEQPIMIKKSQGQRGGGGYHGPTTGENVYKPNVTMDKMMSKVMPSQPRRRQQHRGSPTRRMQQRKSPPRYHGNQYHDDAAHWQDYEPNSPTSRSYRYSAENLSEDEDTVTSQSHAMRNQSRISTLNEAERYESTLSNLLSSPSFDSQEYNESLTRARNKLKVLYERMVINDIEAASNENLEQKLWRNVYYQVIEILREQIRSCPEQDSSELRDNLVLLLDQGTAFYESLLESLQHKNHFKLKDILMSASARKRHRAKAGKRSQLAILSCQRVFICLGDIARYREQANHSSNYGRARHCYMQAQILAPKNGRPYNQLAILAVKTRHKLDAVYYYVRSLVTSNAILSARESLMALFDEVRRKLDYVAQKKDEKVTEKGLANLKVKGEGSKVDRSSVDDATARRWEEVWILPGSEQENNRASQVQKQISLEEIPELKLPLQEIAKHFVLLFLNIHGKLFTRIGLESFPEILTKTLKLFEATIENRKFMSDHRLLQLYAVNLFAVLNADKLSIHGSAHDSTQNQCRTLCLSFSIFAITVETVNKIFKSGNTDPFVSEELAILLPSVKVMFDWMYANKSCWYPPPQDLTEPGLNIWDQLAELCNWICNHPSTKPAISIYKEMDEGLHEVFLPEDTQLAGFSPLDQAFSDPRYIENEMISTENKLRIQQTVRISLIRDFLEYLCGMEEPLLAFKQGKYVNVAPIRSSSWTEKPSHDDSVVSDYDIDDFSTADNERFYPSDDQQQEQQGEFSELRKYRDSLQMTKELHEKRQTQMKTSLESEEKVKLEICPRYLVPDTNCFIDHLDLVEKLVMCVKFKVATPLVVVGELEGLATEKKGESAHAENVHRSALEAVKFIEKCFSSNNPKFCALTKRGTELQTLRFRSEDTQSSGVNDDFILQSTHAYAKIHSKNTDLVVNGEKVVRRTVVLLTDDRNLRLKALLMQDVATKSIVDFCRWVKI